MDEHYKRISESLKKEGNQENKNFSLSFAQGFFLCVIVVIILIGGIL